MVVAEVEVDPGCEEDAMVTTPPGVRVPVAGAAYEFERLHPAPAEWLVVGKDPVSTEDPGIDIEVVAGDDSCQEFDALCPVAPPLEIKAEGGGVQGPPCRGRAIDRAVEV